MSRISLDDLIEKKHQNKKITMLTAYDYPMALMIDQTAVDIILVGDSVANVVLGLDTTVTMTMDEMIYHASAVNRAVKRAFVIGDMPYLSYQKDITSAVEHAQRYIDIGCDAVKVEWFDQCLNVVKALKVANIPVMGHVGLTPQTAEKMGGFKVQGKESEQAAEIVRSAKVLQDAGCFSLILECMPQELAALITESLQIPTIGIGAGIDCDGQVLVVHDLLGLYDKHTPKFVKKYVDLKGEMMDAVQQYCQEVSDKSFPDEDHSYTMSSEEFLKLKKIVVE